VGLKVVRSETVEINDVPGVRVVISGALKFEDHRFEVSGELLLLYTKDRYFQILIASPKPGLDRIRSILEKIEKSIRFD
jgi:hypothetical protein